MRLTMLGTGYGIVADCYNTCFLLENEEGCLLVDGGGGIKLLQQLKAAGHDWRKIRTMFVTHKHMDHIMGILWMLRAICFSINEGTYEGDAAVYGHGEVISILWTMARLMLQEKEYRHLGTRIRLIPLEDGDSFPVMGCSVTAFDIHSTKAKQFGFRLTDGEGHRLTCCGDEPCTEAGLPYAENCDWLLHEAFCLHAQADRFQPYEKHHSTVKVACELAERLRVKNVVLYHTEEENLAERKRLYTDEGRQYYSGNLWVPDDLDQISLW